MPNQYKHSTRRAILGNTLKLGAGSVLLATTPACAANQANNPAADSHPLTELTDLPKCVLVAANGNELKLADRQGSRVASSQTVVNMDHSAAGQEVRVSCPIGPLLRVVLRWETNFPGDTIFLGDAWERSYDDLQWRFLKPERIMPWSFAAHQEASGRTFTVGVKTQPTALCFWTVDVVGIFLWLDFRNGGAPGGGETLDWLHTTTPRECRFGREKVTYHREEPAGANPLRV